jgi:hypothetical protein
MLQKHFRLLTLLCTAGTLATAQLPQPYPANTTVNIVRTWDALRPGLDATTIQNQPTRDARQTTAYFDGLGRPLQTVIKQGSMETTAQAGQAGGTAVDLVTFNVYDELGREPIKYLPFAANNADGKFKLNPFAQQQAFMQAQYGAQGETFFYSKIVFEPSPLSRIEKTMAPGNNWTGAGRGVQTKYWINTAKDSVRMWNVANGTPGSFGTYSSSSTFA